MASTPKQTIIIVGGTGRTGSSIVDGLLEADKYNVIVGVREASLSKPEVQKLRERGVEIRAVDLSSNSPAELDAALKGVDVVICTTHLVDVDKQVVLADAAKRVGVKRFIPNDWASPCVRGVRKLFDQKAAIQDHIKSIGLGYTFVDVGSWAELLLPADLETSMDIFLPTLSHKVTGNGTVRLTTTHVPDIGKFVARIIADDRTLNQYVFCWGDEASENEIWDIARKAKLEVTGEPLKATPKHQTEEELVENAKNAPDGTIAQVGAEYMVSLNVRGDNTLANAKKPEYGGALDARELFPDLKVLSLEEAAKLYYTPGSPFFERWIKLKTN